MPQKKEAFDNNMYSLAPERKKHLLIIFLLFSFVFFFYFHLMVAIDDTKFKEIAHFQSSQRGSVVLYYDERRFTRDGTFTDSINWRCCYFRDKCRARAITKNINGQTRVRVTNPIHTCTPKRIALSVPQMKKLENKLLLSSTDQ